MTTAGQCVDRLLARVRDAQGIGMSRLNPPTTADGRTYARHIIGVAQNMVNCWETQSLSTFTMDTQPNTNIYPISTGLVDLTGRPVFTKIIGIRDELQHSLVGPVPFRTLAHVDLRWMLKVAAQHKIWSLFGKDQLILYPARNQYGTVVIIGATFIPDLNVDADVITLTDDMVPQILDLAEAMALFKLRSLDNLKPALQRLIARYKAEKLVSQFVEQLSNPQGEAS